MKVIHYSVIVLAFSFLFPPVKSQDKQWHGPFVDFSHGKLEVSENHRFLRFEDGTPLFYLGGTAWELFHRLTLEQAEKYFDVPVQGVDWALVIEAANE